MRRDKKEKPKSKKALIIPVTGARADQPPGVESPTPIVNGNKKLKLAVQPLPSVKLWPPMVAFGATAVALVALAVALAATWVYICAAIALLGAYGFATRWVAARAREPDPHSVVQFLERVRRALAYESLP